MIAVTCDNPPQGEIGVPYSHVFPVTGETGTVVWSISAGALPPGLTLNSATGEVSGTPTAPAAIANFTVLVTDDAPSEDTEPCSIAILAAVAVTCDNPPAGIVNVPYSHFFPATGGDEPYTFSISAGALPNGLTIDAATGEVSGTPTVAGTFDFTVEVEDDLGATADVDCSITITTVSIECDSPPNGKVNVAYSHAFPATGGDEPYTFSISAGALPTGLSLNTSTGVCSGTPTLAGLYTFTVMVTDDADNEDSVECSIRICPMNAQGS